MKDVVKLVCYGYRKTYAQKRRIMNKLVRETILWISCRNSYTVWRLGVVVELLSWRLRRNHGLLYLISSSNSIINNNLTAVIIAAPSVSQPTGSTCSLYPLVNRYEYKVELRMRCLHAMRTSTFCCCFLFQLIMSEYSCKH